MDQELTPVTYDIDIVDPGQQNNNAVYFLKTFIANGGRIAPSQIPEDKPTGILIAKPDQLDFPVDDTRSWDIIIDPTSGVSPTTLARNFRGRTIQTDMRYILPADGLVLSSQGFSEHLSIGLTALDALHRSHGIPFYDMLSFPRKNAVQQWITKTIIRQLNKGVEPTKIPKSTTPRNDTQKQRIEKAVGAPATTKEPNYDSYRDAKEGIRLWARNNRHL